MSLTCSNCYRKLPRSRAVLTVQFNKPDTKEAVTMNLKEVLAYMTKVRPPDRLPDDLSLCIPCHNIFITMLDNYVSFLKRSKLDSPVYKLLRCEDDEIDFDIWPDMFDIDVQTQAQTQAKTEGKHEYYEVSHSDNYQKSSLKRISKETRHRKAKNQGGNAKTKSTSMTAAEAESEFYTTEAGAVLLKCIKCPNPEECQFGSVAEWAGHQVSVHENNVGWGHGPIIKPGNKKPLYRKLLPCPVCWKSIPTIFLASHVDSEHHNKPHFICSICGKGFGRKISLKQHVLIHDEGVNRNTHLCLRCGSTFRNKANLLRHEMAHTQDFPRPFKCEKCGLAFETKLVLKNHYWTHVPLDQRPKTYPCNRCSRAFETQKRLRSHLREHKQSETRDAKCEFCEKAYHRKNALKDHLTSFHKLTEAEAKASAGIASKITVIRDGVEGPAIEARPMKPATACHLCSRKYSRREYLTTHYMALHGKSELEAKALTGLESRRNLTVPTARRTGVGRKLKREREVEPEETEPEPTEIEVEIGEMVEGEEGEAVETVVGEAVEGVVTVPYQQEQYWINPAALPATFYTTL